MVLLDYVKRKLDSLTIGTPPSDFEGTYPTLTDAALSASGVKNDLLCRRCLSLLYYVAADYGDGSTYQGQKLPHSAAVSGGWTSCVLCRKTRILFEAARAHVSFENSLRSRPTEHWSLTWASNVPDRQHYPKDQHPHPWVTVLITADHRRGYGWGIGGFKFYPGRNKNQAPVLDAKHPSDFPIMISLASSENAQGQNSSPETFLSTVGSGVMQNVATWANECVQKHPQCNHVFDDDSVGAKAAPWHPDRLLYLNPSGTSIFVRIVEKSETADFPAQDPSRVPYLSLSHCWGPEPSGGRQGVLTQDNIAAWKRDIPTGVLPSTFQDAIQVCYRLGFSYIWIDSLCILQDSKRDWEIQSAVMGKVYKHAFLNIAALTSSADTEGFINQERDPRVEFGFLVPLASLLHTSGRPEGAFSHGEAALQWNFSSDIPGSASYNAPLYSRAWVFQERNLARRTLGFTQEGVSWACDGFNRSEYPTEHDSGGEPAKLRMMLKSVIDAAKEIGEAQAGADPAQLAAVQQKRVNTLLNNFDYQWHGSITSYTLCGLTFQRDKLMAFAQIARACASSGLNRQKRYLAGFWDMRIEHQMGWRTVEGKKIPQRKQPGEEGYVAPSWSWASIAGPVQPNFLFPSGVFPTSNVQALVDVLAADVVLESEFKFGQVKAGWLRVRGHLNGVNRISSKSGSAALTDSATGQDFWFSSDTVEGHNHSKLRQSLGKVVWLPLLLKFERGALAGSCLILMETSSSQGGTFVQPGEKVYRRLGSGNFGRVADRLSEDRLLLSLGTYPTIDVSDGDTTKLAPGFKRKEDGFTTFVLV